MLSHYYTMLHPMEWSNMCNLSRGCHSHTLRPLVIIIFHDLPPQHAHLKLLQSGSGPLTAISPFTPYLECKDHSRATHCDHLVVMMALDEVGLLEPRKSNCRKQKAAAGAARSLRIEGLTYSITYANRAVNHTPCSASLGLEKGIFS